MASFGCKSTRVEELVDRRDDWVKGVMRRSSSEEEYGQSNSV